MVFSSIICFFISYLKKVGVVAPRTPGSHIFKPSWHPDGLFFSFLPVRGSPNEHFFYFQCFVHPRTTIFFHLRLFGVPRTPYSLVLLPTPYRDGIFSPFCKLLRLSNYWVYHIVQVCNAILSISLYYFYFLKMNKRSDVMS